MKIPDFQRAKREGKKIVVVTGYDALFTRIIEQAGIEVILVGDSLGVVVQGKHDTLTVTMEDMVYHTRIVAGAAERATAFVALGILFTLSGTVVNVIVALAAGTLARRLACGGAADGRIGTWLQRLAGALFVGLGLRLALSGR